MTITTSRVTRSRFTAVFPSDVEGDGGITVTKSGATTTVGIDIPTTLLGAELQDAVDLAAASAAAAAASATAAASSSGVASASAVRYNSLAELQAATIGASVSYVTLSAILTTENGQQSNWRRRSTAGSGTNRGHAQSADGAWWEISNSILYASHFRRTADSTNWGPAIQAMLDYSISRSPGQECRIDAGGPFLIKPSTWSDRIFTITDSITLVGGGGKLIWDSNTASTCDIFQVASTSTNAVQIRMENVRAEPTGWVEVSPVDLWATKGAGGLYGRDVIRINAIAGSVNNYIQEMQLTNCYFGPTNGFSVNSSALTLAQSDRFRGFVLAKNKFWGGIRGLIGDSCAARDNRMTGFNTAFDVWQGSGSSVFDCNHNNCYTNNGSLRWRGGSRLQFRENNCEQFGARSNSLAEGTPINGVIDIDNSVTGVVAVHHVIEDNYMALTTSGSLFTRVAHIGNGGALFSTTGFHSPSIKNNSFAAVTGALASGSDAIVIDADVTYAKGLASNSYVNNSTAAIMTVNDSGEGTEGIPRALTFSNSWVAHASYTGNNRVIRDNGRVTLTLSISGGTVTSGTVVAVVPAGWRPEVITPFILSANNTMILGAVGADGNVTILGTGNATLTYGAISYIPAKTVFGISG